MKPNGMWIAALLLAGCNQPGRQDQAANEAPGAPQALMAPEAPVAPVAPNAPAPPKASLPEPKGPIDPKSVEAAGQVVQGYGALIEQKRFAEAEKLWGDPSAAAQFSKQLKGYSETHLEIGALGESEGAAGSIYVTEPVTFYGKDGAGKAFRRPANVILRRVNDVPGSTAAQRRWHIERIEWAS